MVINDYNNTTHCDVSGLCLCWFWQIDATHPAGWTVYAVFILSTFLILKVINMRLHKSLGKDPEPEEEEQEEEREGAEGEEGEETEKSDKDKEC